MKHLVNIDIGTLVLRVTLGVVLVAHSLYLKLWVYSLTGTAQFFSSVGLPEVLAYIVFFIESAAGVALILGVYTRFFSALIIPILLGATWLHFSNGWLFSNAGGGWEYPLSLTMFAIVQLCLGSGKYALEVVLFKKQSYSAA